MLFHYLFFIGSIGGFFLELFYKKFKTRRWIKPGVFKGCYLPLYGMGLVICHLCYIIEISFLTRLLLAAFLLTFIELLCGLVFIKGFEIPLWDYSKELLNYKGLICLKFSFIWLMLASLFFLVFKYIVLYENTLMNAIIFLYEIILMIDFFLFIYSKLSKSKKRNFRLDL